MINLGLSLHNINGGELSFLDEFGTPAAAYSLRNVSPTHTGPVVRVRRSSDDAEADFTAAEITDGTMLNWVNTDVVKYTSDFTSGNEDLNETNGVGTDGETIGGVSDAYKFSLSGGNTSNHFTGIYFLQAGVGYTLSFDYYIPSTNSKVDSIRVRNLFTNTDFSVLDSWQSETITTNSSQSNDLFFQPLDGVSTTIDADGDVFYLKNIVVTQTTADGHVVTWYDQSGNGNDATQATAANQPKIVDAGVLVVENGKPAMEFDGVDDKLIMSSFSSTLAQPNTTFIVNNAPNNTNDNTLIDGIIVSNRHLLIANANNYTLNAGTFANSGVNSDSQSLLYTLWNGASSEFASDGGTPNTINIGTQGLTGLTIGTNFGSSNANDGNIQEIILYNSDQSSNRAAIETNINNHYSIY